jgi:hypothetical protein
LLLSASCFLLPSAISFTILLCPSFC